MPVFSFFHTNESYSFQYYIHKHSFKLYTRSSYYANKRLLVDKATGNPYCFSFVYYFKQILSEGDNDLVMI